MNLSSMSLGLFPDPKPGERGYWPIVFFEILTVFIVSIISFILILKGYNLLILLLGIFCMVFVIYLIWTSWKDWGKYLESKKKKGMT